MSRELFAIPGPISSPKSEGPNELIKRGEAKLISGVNDIIDELNWLPAALEAYMDAEKASLSNQEAEWCQANGRREQFDRFIAGSAAVY